MDQNKDQKPYASISQANERETQEAPLSQNELRLVEFTQSPNISANHMVQNQYSQQKRQPRFSSDIRLLFIMLCLVVLLLIGMNIFIFQDPQVNNKSTLFTSVNQNMSQQGRKQSKKIDISVQQLPNPEQLKKQYQPSSPIMPKNNNYDVQQTKIKKQQFKTSQNSATFKEKIDKIINLNSDTQVYPNGLTTKTLLTPPSAPKPVKKADPAPTHTVKYKLVEQGPHVNKLTTKQTTKQKTKQKAKQITKQTAKQTAKQTTNQKKQTKGSKKVQQTPKEDGRNILSHITKNPYGSDIYAKINFQDLKRAMRWKALASDYYNVDGQLAQEEYKYYNKKYQISNYQELPFCIVIPTANNMAKRRAQKNIKSVLMQNYKNYRVIVIDDGSTDKTGQYIEQFLKNQTIIPEISYKIIKNKQRRYALPNVLYAAKTFCSPKDIFIVLDGDDELLGKQVLKLFNAVFQKDKIWFMYTNFMTSSGSLGYSRPYPPDIMKDNTYRDYGFTVTHLRAYYTQLLLNIKDEDLRDQNNKYFTAAGDMAIAMPCLQQAHERVKYVPQLTYLYNWNTGQNVHGDRLNLQRRNNLKIRAKPRYQALSTLF